MLAALGFSLHGTFALPQFAGADETAHYSYAVVVADGELPTVDTPMPRSVPTIDRWLRARGETRGEHSTIWVANHPPLYYALAAPLVWATDALGPDPAGPRALRVLSAVCATLGIGAVGGFAREAFPDRAWRVIAAAGFAAALPYVAGIGALGYNNALGFLVAATACFVAARMVRRGSTGPRVAAAAAVGTAAALTRAELLVFVPLLLAAFGIGLLAVPGRPPWRRVGGQMAAIAGVPVLLAAWFYVRNQDEYGSFTASSYLLERFDRHGQGTPLGVLTSSEFFGRAGADLFASTPTVPGNLRSGVLFGGPWYSPSWRTAAPIAVVIVGLALLGGLRALVGAVTTPAWWRTQTGSARRWFALVVIATGTTAFVVLSVASATASGHNLSARYLIPLVPFLAVATVWGLDRLAGRILVVTAVTAMFVVETIVVTRIAPRQLLYPSLLIGLPGVNVPARQVALVLALMGAVGTIVCTAWPAPAPEPSRN